MKNKNNSLTSCGLSPATLSKIQRVFSEYPEIKKVWLYGSRAKGDFHTGSDIDLTIDSNSLSYSQLLKIENKLDDLLLPYKIDLSILEKITSPELIEHIKRVGIKFYPQPISYAR